MLLDQELALVKNIILKTLMKHIYQVLSKKVLPTSPVELLMLLLH